jgi:hypothetical protein
LIQIKFRDIISFIKNPLPGEKYEIDSISTFIRLLWKSIVVLILIDIVVGIIIVIPLSHFNLFPQLEEIKITPIVAFKIIVLFPIIEELIFRLPLRISKINLITSFCLIIFLNLNKWYFSNMFLTLLCCSILFLGLYFWTKKYHSFLNRLTYYLDVHFMEFFYFQALLFGFLHLTNYKVDFRYFFLFPFFATSYILIGFFLGYIRVRFKKGIYLCIFSHIFINGIYFFLLEH